MSILLTIAALIVAAAVAYSLLVYKRARSEMWAWWHTFTSLSLSFALGWVIAIWLFQYETQKTDSERKTLLSKLVDQEMAHIILQFEVISRSTFVFSDTTLEFSYLHFEPIGLEEAAKSGLFEDHLTLRMLVLSKELREFNSTADFATSLLPLLSQGTKHEMVLKFAFSRLDLLGSEIIKHSRQLREKLGLPPVRQVIDTTSFQIYRFD